MEPDEISTSLKEWRVLPSLTKKNTEPTLETRLTSNITLKIPFLNASMQAVGGPDLATALSKQGGMGIIYGNQPIDDEAEMVKRVKTYKAGFVYEPFTVEPGATCTELKKYFKEKKFSVYPITQDGKPHGVYKGVAFSEDFRMSKHSEMTSMDFVKDVKTHDGDISLEDATEKLRYLKQKCLPLLNKDGTLKAVVFRKDILDEENYPKQLFDKEKRLMVGAGINTFDYEKRIPQLINAGVDLLLIDSSQGYSEYQHDTIKHVKKNYPETPVIAGNVITSEGFKYLLDAGADAIKIGMGGGSICITQEVKRIGRGQAKTIKEILKARNESGANISIISDGGIVNDGDIFISLALGADAVMMGYYFARFDESPTPVMEHKGRLVKPYWGEGSLKAKNIYRYGSIDKSKFVIEGVEGFVPYFGKLEVNVAKTINTLNSSMKTSGRYTIKELHNASLEYISEGSRIEGDTHDIII